MSVSRADLTVWSRPTADPVGESVAGLAAADPPAVPRHVAIIMDGNGRWAARKGLPRSVGHREGLEAMRRIVRHAGHRAIRYLTLYAFSTENWNRPQDEVSSLMDLLESYVDSDLEELEQAGVRVRVIGRRDDLAPGTLALIENVEARTAHNGRLDLVVAFNYGGRNEIVRAARRAMCDAIARGADPMSLDEGALSACMDTAEFPDPDLLIRTSGEHRLSNFLLWQCAYAEFVFVDECWPAFDEAHFDRALEVYRGRERRFGDVGVGAGRS